MAEREELPDLQQFPDWIEKYRAATIAQSQERPSRLGWLRIRSLFLALAALAVLVLILGSIYKAG
jgi:hypothetical protein